MHVGTVARSVLGAVVVYVVVAACGSDPRTSHGGFLGVDSGGAQGEPIGDASALETGAGDILDAIANPVPDAKADPATSGSRLKAKRYVGEDGSSQFLGWYDSARKEECSFYKLTDGTYRCIPNGTYAYSYFADGGCTQPLVIVTAPCTSPKYALQATAVACTDSTWRVLPVAGTFTGAKVFVGNPAACTGIATPAGQTFLTVGAEIAPSAFAAAHVATDP